METVRLGSLGLAVSRQGLGCVGMSELYGQPDDAESIATLRLAVESGVTLFDTADVYGSGANEALVGDALRPHRERIVLATKFGAVRGADGARGGTNGRPEYVRQACEASLRRLGLDHIDLYFQHRVDVSVPIEDTVEAMAELVRAGKVRFLGLSEASAEDIRRAHAVHPMTAVQTEYSLWSRDVEAEILPTCRELGIGFVAYSPLGRGFLTGAFRRPEDLAADDYRRGSPRFQGENLEKNITLVERLRSFAETKGCTSAQLALAWTMHQPGVVPIPGTKRSAYLTENVAACEVSLSATDLGELDAIFPPGAAAGPRYPASMMPGATSAPRGR